MQACSLRGLTSVTAVVFGDAAPSVTALVLAGGVADRAGRRNITHVRYCLGAGCTGHRLHP